MHLERILVHLPPGAPAESHRRPLAMPNLDGLGGHDSHSAASSAETVPPPAYLRIPESVDTAPLLPPIRAPPAPARTAKKGRTAGANLRAGGPVGAPRLEVPSVAPTFKPADDAVVADAEIHSMCASDKSTQPPEGKPRSTGVMRSVSSVRQASPPRAATILGNGTAMTGQTSERVEDDAVQEGAKATLRPDAAQVAETGGSRRRPRPRSGAEGAGEGLADQSRPPAKRVRLAPKASNRANEAGPSVAAPRTPEGDRRIVALRAGHGSRRRHLSEESLPNRSANQLRRRFSVVNGRGEAGATVALPLRRRVPQTAPVPAPPPRRTSRAGPRARRAAPAVGDSRVAVPVVQPTSTPTSRLWSAAEDELLAKLRAAHGDAWTVIASHMNRSPDAVRNRRRTLLKETRRENAAQTSEQAAIENQAQVPKGKTATHAVAGSAALDQSAVGAAVTALTAVYEDCARKTGSELVSVRRENIALRWALVRSSAHSTEGGGAVPAQREPAAAAAPAADPSVESEFASYNPVLQAVLRAKMAVAWSKSALPYLPADMFVRVTRPLSVASNDPHLWSTAVLLDFLKDMMRGPGIPPSQRDAHASVAALVEGGVLPIMTAATRLGAGHEILHLVTRSLRQAFDATLSSKTTDMRWIAVLAANVLAPLLHWSAGEAMRAAFRHALDAVCREVLESCSDQMHDARSPDFARGTEVSMAIYDTNPGAAATVARPTLDRLSAQSSLFAVLAAASGV